MRRILRIFHTGLVVQSESCDFVITGSQDGVVKFWKRLPDGIEFVKAYKSHVGKIQDMDVSPDGTILITIGATDKSLKIYSVVDYDMIGRHEIPFDPVAAIIIQDNTFKELHLVM